jgi:hypothetical protein
MCGHRLRNRFRSNDRIRLRDRNRVGDSTLVGGGTRRHDRCCSRLGPSHRSLSGGQIGGSADRLLDGPRRRGLGRPTGAGLGRPTGAGLGRPTGAGLGRWRRAGLRADPSLTGTTCGFGDGRQRLGAQFTIILLPGSVCSHDFPPKEPSACGWERRRLRAAVVHYLLPVRSSRVGPPLARPFPPLPLINGASTSPRS